MTQPLLEIKNLTISFGGLVAVQHLDLIVNPGEIVGLIGPNGAGKTTVFNLINGFLAPTSGEVRFKGERVSGLKPHKVCARGIARTPAPAPAPATCSASAVPGPASERDRSPPRPQAGSSTGERRHAASH